ncbi:unnamed protein product [Anisakis simplex]|uniref:NAM-associated domain-containing protein n=1 Tax=Anisakis simplex TaxID=6269 RepID=A0A0M3JFV8_ANISI|nr:unnamed protein product [Anisakis simplex]
MTCQESSAEPHEQFRESEEMCKEEQLQSNDAKKSIGKVNDRHFDAATDLIIKQLTERRSLYRQHRQEAKAAKSLRSS